MHGYRLTIGSIHLHPWLSRGATWREGWRLHLRLVVENFGMANPEGCRFADFVSTAEVHAHAHVDFGFIYRAIVNKRIPFNVKASSRPLGDDLGTFTPRQAHPARLAGESTVRRMGRRRRGHARGARREAQL